MTALVYPKHLGMDPDHETTQDIAEMSSHSGSRLKLSCSTCYSCDTGQLRILTFILTGAFRSPKSKRTDFGSCLLMMDVNLHRCKVDLF